MPAFAGTMEVHFLGIGPKDHRFAEPNSTLIFEVQGAK